MVGFTYADLLTRYEIFVEESSEIGLVVTAFFSPTGFGDEALFGISTITKSIQRCFLDLRMLELTYVPQEIYSTNNRTDV